MSPACSRKKLRTHEWGLMLIFLMASALLTAISLRESLHPVVDAVALVPVFVVIRFCAPRSSGICGLIWGLTLFVVSGTELGPTIPLTPAALLFVTLLPAAFIWFGSWLTGHIGFSPFVLAAAWMLLEVALMPTGALDRSKHIDHTWISWFGSLPAPLLIGFCLAWINAGMVELALRCNQVRQEHASLSCPDETDVRWQVLDPTPSRYFLSARSTRAPPFDCFQSTTVSSNSPLR